ncbi:glycosyltransferase family 2 protein [Formosa algae]|uniref:glycosyltransferase family 2 protein n=1 Tax=Formosa algae TaxID=225843 RepID=UPI000CCDF9EB|nr:glycosyltransferase family 2 protein [Formosa algae]PNW26868.1 hypothetical protein BKP44_15420 [Formosa algae]
MPFKVSVIIPVYNAEKYLKIAVDSVLIQPEVGEIILVEDKSPDNALAICKDLAKQYNIIKLLQHPDKGNHGAGASRNLGVINASCDYIAFLDADDYYLPDRFKHETAKLFGNNCVDGMYGALGFHFYNAEQEERYLQKGFKELTTIQKSISEKDLFPALIGLHKDGYIGHIHLNTLTVKKSVFDSVGLFNIELRLHQDYEWLMRASAKCDFIPGSITKAIGMRGVHEDNRIINKSNKAGTISYKTRLWLSMQKWANENKSPKEVKLQIKKNIYIEKSNTASGLNSIILLLNYPYQGLSFNHSVFKTLVYKSIGRNIVSKTIFWLRHKILD